MRKNLKITLLLLTIMAAMCMFVGCGDGKQDDSAFSPEQNSQPAEQLSDTAGTDNDEKQGSNEVQGNNTKDGHGDTEKDQTEGKQDEPEGGASGKFIDAVGNQAADSNSAADESTGKPSNAPVSDTPGTSVGGSDELSVNVESVGDNSVVGNKISIESGSDGNSEIMVVGVGEDNKVLVTVYFAKDASYVYRIIRNGGADAETRDGSFSDIKEGLTLYLTGYYKGEDFYADKVVISDVIID